ncbi:alpha/beta-hydrolase [Dendrothele bispora CBS 962.96]|uniref:Alpha/beta-hydrolase n=1 Tax=Dendrothele bispora (strain CBS 962.96) TaxID=1314807 RepID=A0A4S8L1J8_DENBC|nr:alpha/beta-hydrolase [Dendrothele bispora CBS 962.96]
MGLRHLFLFLSFVLVIGTYFSWGNGNDKALDFVVEVPGSNVEVGAENFIASDDDFDWGKIKPSENLSWHDCYDGFQCARFKVPLNYSEPEGRPAILALIRLEASDSDDNRGPVLFNPGGPGGSGVELVLKRGRNFSTILGPRFDIVGFDPRGVSRSLPQVSFYNSRVERELWSFSTVRELNHSNHGLADTWGKALVTGRLAAERDLDKDVLAHINTGNTARDMLSITEAHGYEKLKYWGFSYGTILGATFAAMFPDKVERLVIDGVVDSVDYYSAGWKTNLRDTSATLQDFFDFCHTAGPSKCAFYASSPSQIGQNLFELYSSLKKKPIPVRTDKSYGLVDYARLRETIFTALYVPYTQFVDLAQGLADLKKENGTKLFMMKEGDPFQCNCSPDVFGQNTEDASHAISCTDAKPIPGSYEDAVKYFEEALEFSEWSSVWTGIRVSCSAWRASNGHFQGPVEGNTSFPLLMIGNRADPVTPLASAQKMSKAFPGSVVLSQDSPGHCSLSAPSPCTQSYVAAYFVNGTLPEPGTWCPVIGTPFNQDDALKELDLLSSGCTDKQEITNLNDGQQRTFSSASSLFSSPLFSENDDVKLLRAVFDMSRDSINLPTRSRLPLHV